MKSVLTILVCLALAVSAPANSVSTESWAEIIIGRVLQDYQLDPADYMIELLSSQLKTMPTDGTTLELKALTDKEPSGLFTMLATVWRGGESLETSQVRMRIRRFAPVLVAIDKVRRGEELKPEQVTVERMEITNLREKPMLSLEETAGYRVKRNLRQGTIVTTGALEAIPDIESGTETLIVYDDGLCRITAPGTALQSGSAGDVIKVRNKATKKIVMARVIDGHAVAIDP